jgi:hypothetical protein
MQDNKERSAQALFESTNDDGTYWLFIVLAHDGWAIARNGERVAGGPGTPASIRSGVRKYLSLTGSVTGRDELRCDDSAVARSA